jgi:hypothetical protein
MSRGGSFGNGGWFWRFWKCRRLASEALVVEVVLAGVLEAEVQEAAESNLSEI